MRTLLARTQRSTPSLEYRVAKLMLPASIQTLKMARTLSLETIETIDTSITIERDTQPNQLIAQWIRGPLGKVRLWQYTGPHFRRKIITKLRFPGTSNFTENFYLNLCLILTSEIISTDRFFHLSRLIRNEF